MGALLHAGLMSGTSLDGMDAVLVDFSKPTPAVVGHLHRAFAQPLRERLLLLAQGDMPDEIEALGTLGGELGDFSAALVLDLLAQTGTAAHRVQCIGSHGVTVRHRPNAQWPFSLQAGNPAVLAARTGIAVVADFRSCDIAYGGQGAPLVPAFHAQMWGDGAAVLNLGGIANITWIPAEGQVIASDSGPGNGLMDAWTARHLGEPYDHKGQWARSGEVLPELLSALQAHPYLARALPKSTGREEFNLAWLESLGVDEYRPQDVQRTLLEFTATCVQGLIRQLPAPPQRVIACGGGAYNSHLVQRIAQVGNVQVVPSDECGLQANLVEAVAFAWLGMRRLQEKPATLTGVSGADRAVVSGAVWLPSDGE